MSHWALKPRRFPEPRVRNASPTGERQLRCVGNFPLINPALVEAANDFPFDRQQPRQERLENRFNQIQHERSLLIQFRDDVFDDQAPGRRTQAPMRVDHFPSLTVDMAAPDIAVCYFGPN